MVFFEITNSFHAFDFFVTTNLNFYFYFTECSTNTYLTYNNGNPFCIQPMTATSCANMNSTCALNQPGGQLLKITDSSIMIDTINAYEKWVYVSMVQVCVLLIRRAVSSLFKLFKRLEIRFLI